MGPVQRLRFHGVRKLNWEARPENSPYLQHLNESGFDGWLNMGPLTVVVGPNGGGKSTVIDLLRALRDAKVWPSLPRENYPGADFSGFDAEGSDWKLSTRFSKYTPDAKDMFRLLSAHVIGGRETLSSEHVLMPKYYELGEWENRIQCLVDDTTRFTIHFFSATGRVPASELDDGELVSHLNELSPSFPSVMANPQNAPFRCFRGEGARPGRVGVLFKDDPGQHAFVDRNTLPLGWLQIASILNFLRHCTTGSLVLLDEPEQHLHPNLQRVMLEVIVREREKLDLQVVIATHSSVLTSPALTSKANAKVWVAARGRCEELSDSRRVLDDLGVTSGDLVQSNGIIWVEGPSDRLYLKTWIGLRAAARSLEAPIERVHYSLALFGGALTKHITLQDDRLERIGLRAINRNFLVVLDRDLPGDQSGTPWREKVRLIEEAENIGRGGHVWLTEGYTIEDYLPSPWNTFLNRSPGGRTRIISRSKVDLAEEFAAAAGSWEASFRPESDLCTLIDAVIDTIQDWQTPQEIIEARYLPPYLEPDGAGQ